MKQLRVVIITGLSGSGKSTAVRALEDMNLLTEAEGGNAHVLNGNMVKLADVGAAYKSKETEDTT